MILSPGAGGRGFTAEIVLAHLPTRVHQERRLGESCRYDVRADRLLRGRCSRHGGLRCDAGTSRIREHPHW